MGYNRDLQLNSSMRCAKFMLIMVSCMFAITAVLLIMVGSTIQTIFGDFRVFVDDCFLSPPALLIAIGFIMLFVAALGVYGAIKESVLVINMYGVCLFLVFILEVAAAIVAFVRQADVNEMLVRTMTEAIEKYDVNPNAHESVDFMQSLFECCGVFGPSDWKNWEPNKEANLTGNAIIVPETCCGDDIDTSRENVANQCIKQYEWGCHPRLDFVISQSIMLIATGATLVAFVQILGVLCAFMLAKTLRRNKSIREARRWQMQQSLGVLISGGKLTPPVNSPMTCYTQLEKTEPYPGQDPITYTPNSPSVN